MTRTIHVGSQKLTDGSEVFNVYLDTEDKNPIAACSEEDARELAETIANAIQRHSVTEIRVKRW